MSVFVGVWPVLDAEASMHDLVDQAYDELPALAWEVGAVVVESPRWTTREDVDGPSPRVPSSPTGLYLVAEAECVARKEAL